MISKNTIKLIRSLEMKKHRREKRLFVAEGPKVVGDLTKGGFRLHALFATDAGMAAEYDGELITADELKRISFLQHPQRLLAVFHMPEQQALRPRADELALALDGVQDPGNMGTIIRIADWFGITSIFCSEDTADAFNPKVVQATMGSLAHVKVTYGNLTELIAGLPEGFPVYGTMLDGTDIYQQELKAAGLIVMGNEGNGISSSVAELLTHRLLIPNYSRQAERAESLNVAIATAVVCAEFRRSRTRM